MRLVVGLGNPGRQYDGTRHNLGFEVADRLAERLAAEFDRERFSARVAEASVGREKLLLAKPLTFMNLSGRTVVEATRFHKLPLEDVLVVCDDFNLDLGRLRLRTAGSHGGHNGLRDVIARLGTDGFPRLRLGIGPLAGRDPVGFCLSKFAPAERDEVAAMIDSATDAAEAWLRDGSEEAMNRFNRKA